MTEVILFHSRGCGHCVQFMPIWKNIIKTVNKINLTGGNINIQDVEAAEMQLMQFGKVKNDTGVNLETIDGFPTIIVKHGGKEIRIGERTKKNIMKAINDITKTTGKKEIVQSGGGSGQKMCKMNGGSAIDYKKKYLKYKKKYMNLKK